MRITLEPEAKPSKIKTMSDLRRFLARTLSKIPGDMKVTDFNVKFSISKP